VSRAYLVLMYRATKRVFDIVVSLFGLVLLAPVFLAIAMALRINSPGPACYRGRRVGKGGRSFEILKFRTMRVDADRLGATSTAADDPRITPIGKWLRHYKLDELPQLVNVLRGDMSLVGPRPQVQWDVDNYTDEERELLSVRPGITDYASLKFRNEAEILRGQADADSAYVRLIRPEKVRLGLEYVRTRSLRVDLVILVRTLLALVGRNV
jgi:lipopolysaccharide/colanic/teichoic acid biosynthesis glycosyltransferase